MGSNGTYDVAQICLNGHLINGSTRRESINNKKYCPRCGSETITNCINCRKDIAGDYYEIVDNWVMDNSSIVKIYSCSIPSFCSGCGKPYSWTEKKIQISQMIIAESDDITPDEKEIMSDSIGDIINDTPNTVYSANRIKKILPKLGKGIGKVLRDIFVDIASDAAKKILLP